MITYAQYSLCRSLCIYIFFTFLYFSVLFLQLKIEDSHNVEAGLTTALLNLNTPIVVVGDDSITFDDIHRPDQFWHWMTTALVPVVYQTKKYNAETLQP